MIEQQGRGRVVIVAIPERVLLRLVQYFAGLGFVVSNYQHEVILC
jgi:hypothetical protein